LRCISEAKRILKPGGALLCEVISRYASLVDGFKYLNINDEKFIKILDNALTTGLHSPGDTTYFTSAFFHSPNDIKSEITNSGFYNVDIVAVEGFANALDSDEILKNEQQANLLLEYIRRTERVPELMGISGHFFAITHK
jgi:SAM-dependent methyltransferase